MTKAAVLGFVAVVGGFWTACSSSPRVFGPGASGGGGDAGSESAAEGGAAGAHSRAGGGAAGVGASAGQSNAAGNTALGGGTAVGDGGTGGDGGGAPCGSPTDPKNCGACGFDCTALANVKPGAAEVTCKGSVCSVPPSACLTGFGHCSSQPNDGCEAKLTDPKNCGSCAVQCAGSTPLCTDSTNGPVCASACSAPNANVCAASCVNLASDPTNCGSCGHDCSALANLKTGAAVSCNASGACVVPAGTAACAPNFANCTSGATDADGCETPTNTNTNCGACGVACSLPNATATCATGTCAITSCSSGFGDCNSTPGCETALNTAAHCGACDKACPTPSNSTPACTGGACAFSCNAGFSLCGSACLNLNTDGANCGTCGHSCLGGACAQGLCQPATVATGIATNPSVFGVDSGNLYFQANDSGSLISNNAWLVSKTATLGTPTLIIGPTSYASFPAVIGPQLYIRAKGPMGPVSVTKCTVASCVPPASFTQLGDVVNSRAQSVFFDTWFTNATHDTLSFEAWDSTGSARSHNETIVATGLPSLSSFNAGSSVYWIFDNGTSRSLFSVDMTTDTRAQLAGNLEAGSVIVDVNAASVLILGANTNNLSRVPLPLGKGNAAPNPLTTVGGTIGASIGATEDASRVYWLDSAGTVSSCLPATCSASTTVIANGQTSASGFYQDATALYWGRTSPNSVVRLAK